MFGFLKDKLKGALKIFSKGVDEKGKTEEKTIEVDTVVEEKAPAQKEKKQPVDDSKPVDTPKKETVKTPIQTEKLSDKVEPQKKARAAVEQKPAQARKEEKAQQKPATAKKEEEKATETPFIPQAVKTPTQKQEEKEKVQEPQSLFSKFTSVFKKREDTSSSAATEQKAQAAAAEKKKEQPKMVVESKRITPEGKIVEEKTIIQAKSDAEEEKEDKEAQEKKRQHDRELAAKEEEKEIQKQKAHEPEKKSFFERITQVITTKTISQEQFEELFFDLEFAMLENNVAVQVIEKLKADLQASIVGVPIRRGDIEQKIINTLRESITDVLSIPVPNILKLTETKKPYIIAFIGVNGAGKTTNLAKVANYLQKNGKSVVIAACDTFRAAAIQQLEEHANRLDVKIIKHDYGADAAAVAFDAVAHAKAKNIDVVLIDTAGRLHSNSNLMDELAKIERVISPDLKLFVGESVTGNDCIEQAMQFNEKVGIDGIILSKADVDEKGGAAISVSYVTKKPIFFIGTGQTYDDLEAFSKEKVLASLDL